MTARPTIPFMRGLIASYYKLEGNICGGSLHVVLDDGNLETRSVQHCLEYATKQNDADGAFLADLLLRFTEAERAEMLGIDPSEDVL